MSDSVRILYAIHVGLWISFIAARLFVRSGGGLRNAPPTAPRVSREYTAAYSRVFLVFHACGIVVFYAGVVTARPADSVHAGTPAQRVVGGLVIAVGAALIGWAIVSLHSWRFRAKLDAGHQLTTTGAFRLLRHPIYSGMNLAALGTVLWVPTPVVGIGFMLIVLGSEVRARAEEALMHRAFGSAYSEYSKRTKRFIPCVY